MRTSRHPYGSAVAIAALSIALAGCGAGSAAKKPAEPATAPSPSESSTGTRLAALGTAPSTIATARRSTVEIFKNAGDSAPNLTLHNPSTNGVPRVFLVIDRTPGWLHVLLPVPPNSSEGWIAADQVTTAKTNYWLQVRRSQHVLRLYQGKHVVVNARAAIGKSDTPTPGGRYFLTELLQAPNPKGAYGPYAYGLSGYSTTLQQFNGHDPIIGIHGTDQPQLLGTSVSHGCIRVDNTVITRLAKMLPLGTPVQITA